MERYEYLWRNKWITTEARSIDDFIEIYESVTKLFRCWKKDGVQLDLESGIGDDYAIFFTKDSEIAKREGFGEPAIGDWNIDEDTE